MPLTSITFDQQDRLGEGRISAVFRGKWKSRDAAVKRIQLHHVSNGGETVLQKLDHRNLVKLLDVESDQDFRYFALELCVASLEQVFLPKSDQKKYRGPLPISEDILIQLAEGMNYIHQHNLVHGNVKPSNVLISATKPVTVKWADFGPVSSAREKTTTAWIAPEVLRNKSSEDNLVLETSMKSDVWSVGCLFFWYLTKGLHPYGDKDTQDNISNNKCVNIGKLGSHPGIDIIRQMLANDPTVRTDMSQVGKHLKHILVVQCLKEISEKTDTLPHGRVVVDRPNQPGGACNDLTSPWRKMVELVVHYASEGAYDEPISLGKQAVKHLKETTGDSRPDLATALKCLAGMLRDEAKYDETITLLKATLSIQEKTKANPAEIAGTLNCLSGIYSDQGKYDEAEPLCKRALEIFEKKVRKDHPEAAELLSNLGAIYHAQGKFKEAEPLLERALQVGGKVLGQNHPSVAAMLNNLAGLYSCQGRHQEAESLHKRALKIRQKALGKDHPDTAESLMNLAGLYSQQKKAGDAESLCQKAVGIQKKTLGKDHPDIAWTLNNLAASHQEQGQFEEAEKLYKQVLEMREKVLGKSHPLVGNTLDSLGVVYNIQGKHAEAERLHKRALEVYEKALGKDHPDVATALNHLASVYKAQGKVGEIVPLLKRALDIKQKVHGTDHADVSELRMKLALLEKLAVLHHMFQRACSSRRE